MHAFGIVLRWVGRILILLAPYIIVCALFYPAGVRPLSTVVCPADLELDNSRYAGANQPDDAPLEISCTSTSSNYSVTVGEKVVLAAVTSLTLGLIALYVSQRLLQSRYRAPGGPATH